MDEADAIVTPGAAAAAAAVAASYSIEAPMDEVDAIVTPGAEAAAAVAVSSSIEEAQESTHPDGNREIRAMIMASLPFPPMPMLASRQLADESSFVDPSSTNSVINSHDLIAHLMNICCCYCKDNDARKQRQLDLQDEMFSRIENVDLSSMDAVYALMGEFTRRYIQLYLPDPEKPQDVRFVSWRDVDQDHVVCRKALEFQRAQDVLYGMCAGQPISPSWSYGDLVMHSARRIVLSKE
jgi:hypothetical protein